MENREQNNSGLIVKPLLGCFVICAILVTCLLAFGGRGTDTPQVTEPTQKEPGITDIVRGVASLKDDLKAVLNDLRNDDLESAASRIDGISENLTAIRKIVNKTKDFLGDNFFLKEQIVNIQNMLDLADMALNKLLKPAIVQLQTYPLSQLRVGDGISTSWICNYIDFAQSVMPDAEALITLANSTDLSIIDSDGKISGYLEVAKGLLETYKEYEAVLPMLKSALGAEGDRLYLIAAQNSSEIRASGGFPGSMGTIRIADGVLTMGDFKSVYDVLATYTPSKAKVTGKENKLFHRGLEAPRDADYCPNFERVAYIWALGYEDEQNEPIDGVISMTPCIVQRLLAVIGTEIELFDGTVLNGENATKILQHDLYFKYFGDEEIKNNADTADELFADAAKKLMELLMDNMDISLLPDYLSVANQCFEDRTLMLWMQDEALQNVIREQGWSGGLNADPENPQAGVYYSCTVPSKMGWFLIMNTEIGERTLNEDGSYTYPITVTFSNDITEKEIQEASWYITGGKNGAIVGSVYFFAPAGGSVGGFEASNGKTIKTDVYNDLQLGYMLSFRIYPNKEITVTYYVTTAPGVETPLTFSKTPTVQDYH